MRRYQLLLSALGAATALALVYHAANRPPLSGQTLTSPVTPERERAYRANNLGVALLEQFSYDAAAQSFRQALQIDPALSVARLNLAIALFYGGHTAEAVREARTTAGLLPDDPHAHYVVALVARAENRLDDATAAFGRVLQLDPDDAGSQVNLGQIYLQERKYADAIAVLGKALSAEPYNVTAAYNLALALTRSGDAAEGQRAMQRFQALRESTYGVSYSQTYLSQGQYAEAIASTGAEPELVNAAAPNVTFSDATDALLPPQTRASGAGAELARPVSPVSPVTDDTRDPAGSVLLFDADGDGDLDLFEIGRFGQRFYRNTRGRLVDETERVGLTAPGDGVGLGAIAGDYDNDGKPDLFLLRDRGNRLLRQNDRGAFEDVTAKAALPAYAGAARSAAFVDVDHDGDLDVVVVGPTNQLLRNNGDGTFTDITNEARVGASGGRGIGIAATDFDNRRDIDMLVANDGGAPVLFRNMRDGSFRDSASETGLPSAAAYTAVAAGDVNKDGYTDFFFAKRDAPGVFALSDGRGRFRTVAAPDGTRGAIAAQFLDYDNDGLLDLLVLFEQRVRLFRNIGGGQWSGTTDAARLGALVPPGTAAFQSIALGDLDGDGDTDAVVRLTNGGLRIWRNEGGNRNHSVRVRLAARVSNRSAVGAKVELRAGSLRQKLEVFSSTPAVAPADVVFGLGARAAADVVRVLWPSGILQAETAIQGGAAGARVVTVTELNRKPSSCPFLFTWNGAWFEFVTDFMGGGEMGDWVAPSAWNRPDPDEYVRIRGDQLRPRGGRYEIRVTNELEEAMFVDRLQLVAVDHPAGVDVFPEEGLKTRPPPFTLMATKGARPPSRAFDDHGHDVLPQINALDRRYPDDFGLLSIRGFAEPHALTLDLGAPTARTVLLMTGWTDYAFSSDNVAASQRGLVMRPPSLQVKDASGTWRTVIDDIGFPVGHPQTVVVDLSGKFLSPAREVRIQTNMRIYWDQILVDTSGGGYPTRLTRVDPIAADLRSRGFSAETTPDGREPFGYNYDVVSNTSPWKVFAGRYTREGDVRPLLRRTDDMFVIARPGDEIALAFDARALPPLPARWARTFLFYVNGYSKEMNPRSASQDTLDPLPFHAMSGYPYGPPEHYPRTKAYREYLARYNTRVVSRSVPPIETAAVR
jgi:tetratricopeptide (TPR) repeat protein